MRQAAGRGPTHELPAARRRSRRSLVAVDCHSKTTPESDGRRMQTATRGYEHSRSGSAQLYVSLRLAEVCSVKTREVQACALFLLSSQDPPSADACRRRPPGALPSSANPWPIRAWASLAPVMKLLAAGDDGVERPAGRADQDPMRKQPTHRGSV